MAVQMMILLKRRGFQVGAISLFDPLMHGFEGELSANGISVWHLGKRPGFDPRVYPRLHRVIKSFSPSIIHTHLSLLLYSLPSTLFYRPPAMIHTVHSPADKEAGVSMRWIHRVAFRRGVVPVAVSEVVLKSLQKMYGIVDGRLIPNGIAVERFRADHDGRRNWRRLHGFSAEDVLFVCVARFCQVKNHQLLVRAFGEAAKQSDRIHLVLLGEGPLEEMVRKQAAELCPKGRVHFLGVLPDVARVLNASDVFVLVSQSEGNPLSLLEAMASRLPIVATSVGGIPELVQNGREGILVQSEDCAGLTDVILRVSLDKDLRNSLGRAAGMKATSAFDISLQAQQYIDLYNMLLAREEARSAA